MKAQTEFDFTGISIHPENNKGSEEILLEQSERLSNNCRKIYRALKSGAMLTGASMMQLFPSVLNLCPLNYKYIYKE